MRAHGSGGQAVVGVGLNDQLFETGEGTPQTGVRAEDAPLAVRMAADPGLRADLERLARSTGDDWYAA